MSVFKHPFFVLNFPSLLHGRKLSWFGGRSVLLSGIRRVASVIGLAYASIESDRMYSLNFLSLVNEALRFLSAANCCFAGGADDKKESVVCARNYNK